MIAVVVALIQPLAACPFCEGITQRTLRSDIASARMVAFGTFIGVDEHGGEDGGAISRFRIESVLVGNANLRHGTARLDGRITPGQHDHQLFLLISASPSGRVLDNTWPVSSRSAELIEKMVSLPVADPADPAGYARRLQFFLPLLDDVDAQIALTAYDEFARAPYKVVSMLEARFDREHLIKRIDSDDTPTALRRLSLVMLTIVGERSDAAHVQRWIDAADQRTSACFDALLGCLISLRGPDAVQPMVERFVLADEAEFEQVEAVVNALRFHAMYTDVVPADRLRAAYRRVLDRPLFADLAIPELAAMADWQSMPRLVQMFADAEDDYEWVRPAIAAYLRACPLPEAQDHVTSLSKIDANAFRRSSMLLHAIRQRIGDRSESSDK